jgi:hypothetical protein
LSGMSISTMYTFYNAFWKRFCEKNRDSWIHYPTTPEEAAENLETYRRLGFPGKFVVIIIVRQIFVDSQTFNYIYTYVYIYVYIGL